MSDCAQSPTLKHTARHLCHTWTDNNTQGFFFSNALLLVFLMVPRSSGTCQQAQLPLASLPRLLLLLMRCSLPTRQAPCHVLFTPAIFARGAVPLRAGSDLASAEYCATAHQHFFLLISFIFQSSELFCPLMQSLYLWALLVHFDVGGFGCRCLLRLLLVCSYCSQCCHK